MTTTTRIKVTGSKAAGILGDTTDVDLVIPSPGMSTQRDANVSFDNRLTALEPMLTVIDGGIY